MTKAEKRAIDHHLRSDGRTTLNRTLFPLAGISQTLCLAAGLVVADTNTIRTLTQITMNLDHRPSDADKAVLGAIIESDDSSEEEAALAMALANMERTVTAADAERLLDIVDDDLSDESARKLAAVLLRINQSPSDEDKLTLTALLSD